MEIRVLRGQTQPTAPPTTDVVANGPAGGPIGRLREPETQRCAWPADCLAWSSTDTRHRALLANLRPRDTKGRHSCVEQRGLRPGLSSFGPVGPEETYQIHAQFFHNLGAK